MDVTEAKDRTEVNESWFFPWWAVLVQGIFSLIIGLLLITNPFATTLVIVQFVGMFWLVTGIISIVSIFADRTLWGLNLISGIIGIMAGLAVLQHPLWSTVLLPTILVIFIAVNGIIIGLINLFGAFKKDGIATAILGIISIIFGILLLSSPFVAALALAWVYGIFGVAGGIMAIVFAFQRRKLEEPV